jgi:hypothetical protein
MQSGFKAAFVSVGLKSYPRFDPLPEESDLVGHNFGQW